MANPIQFILGATYPFRALALFVRQPALRQYVVFPILLNLLLGVTLYAGLLYVGFYGIDWVLHHLGVWLHSLSNVRVGLPPSATLPTWVPHFPQWSLSWPGWMPHLPQWSFAWPRWVPQLSLPPLHWPRGLAGLPDWALIGVIALLRLVLVILLFLITGLVLLQFGVLLGAPWYGKLSEEIERQKTGRVVLVEGGLLGPVWDIWRAVLYELKKIGLTLLIAIPTLLLNIVPGWGTAIATVIGITLGATLVCMDFLDAALERRRLRFRDKLGCVRRGLPGSASFGLICLGLVSIPLINLLAIPVCVAAGTLFFCDQILPELSTTLSEPPSRIEVKHQDSV